ncbi:hypothetical protein GGTG_08814 [Gaeumannomyces tritici R3-111a-1]|uniref:Uncharacterized protein n=1 Tax=Gaeumannomyces tritici (strain R3-111a-1) TaxID=644352 RepID=J3P5M4_GAET3|nr:hypothetical protein GGTG_08814 [Gaeumannomyces tritici R3-111a-1]EJT74976.1 hypothetical protein GGTG_08814 [Gaeumannomyces tritici R3-111a-1]
MAPGSKAVAVRALQYIGPRRDTTKHDRTDSGASHPFPSPPKPGQWPQHKPRCFVAFLGLMRVNGGRSRSFPSLPPRPRCQPAFPSFTTLYPGCLALAPAEIATRQTGSAGDASALPGKALNPIYTTSQKTQPFLVDYPVSTCFAVEAPGSLG